MWIGIDSEIAAPSPDSRPQSARRMDKAMEYGRTSDAEQKKVDDIPAAAVAAVEERDTSLQSIVDKFGLAEFKSELHALGVKTVADLGDIEKADLEEIGMKPLPRKKLLRILKEAV